MCNARTWRLLLRCGGGAWLRRLRLPPLAQLRPKSIAVRVFSSATIVARGGGAAYDGFAAGMWPLSTWRRRAAHTAAYACVHCCRLLACRLLRRNESAHVCAQGHTDGLFQRSMAAALHTALPPARTCTKYTLDIATWWGGGGAAASGCVEFEFYGLQVLGHSAPAVPILLPPGSQYRKMS